MTSYNVYQFADTSETCVLPTNWVNEGLVKYDSRKASEYAKKGKAPYKKWPTYKVEPISTVSFGKSVPKPLIVEYTLLSSSLDSYDAAYRAESVLLEKSDLGSTDMEAINNPTQILDKKRRRNRVVLSNASSSPANESESSSSEDDVANVASVKLPPFNTTPNTTVATTTKTVSVNAAPDYENNNGVQIEGVDDIYNETPREKNLTDDVILTNVSNDVPLTLATDRQVNELKELIIAQNNLIEQQNMKIDNLTALVTNMSKQLKKVKRDDDDKNNNYGDLTNITTRWTFPLQTLEDVKTLDESLQNTENGGVKEFKSYLLQLGGTTLKTTIKFIIKEIYSLELQQKINYTGRENKFATNNLIQTKLIIEIMQRNTSRTQVEAINEYMYHMQHVSDRIRAMTKKTK